VKISIITVCYNSAATIRDTIDSVIAQTYPHIEYIIVDGASTDNTIAVIGEYQDKITCIISEPDKGLYDAMNKGILAATGEIIGILNSDDIYESTHIISYIATYFATHPHSDLIFGDVVFVKPDQLNTITRYYNAQHFKAWKLRFGWMPPHPATFIRKTAYQKVGLYSLDYKISADYELFVKMLLINCLKYTRINKVLVRMRTGGISSSGIIRSNIKLNIEIVKACRSNGIYTNLFFVLTKIPFKLLELFRRPVISE
jgi:glycosyltransferase involved in cell wall biosynthesis